MPWGFILGLVILLGGCGSLPSGKSESFLDRPERKLSTFQARFPGDMTQRIQAAPKEILKYLNTMDSTDQYRAYLPTPEEIQIFRAYFELLPAQLRDLMNQSLVGIYFIENFTGGGMTDFLYDETGKLYLVLYLNPEILKKSLEEWIQYRDRSPFTEDPSWGVKVSVSGAYRGLLHTLVHEGAHMWDYLRQVTPFIEPYFKKSGPLVQKPFTLGVWRDYQKPETVFQVLGKSKYSSYGLGGRISRSLAPGLYESLGRSPFCSLYGAQNWGEDFAETFTWYYLKHRLGISYEVVVSQKGQPVGTFTPNLEDQTPQRLDLLRSFLEP